MKRIVLVVLCATAVLAVAGCATKIDWATKRKLIVEKLVSAGITDTEATCVSSLLAGYTDDQLSALDKEFTASSTASSAAAKKFQDATAECTKGTNVKTMVAQLKVATPTLTDEQAACATTTLMAKSGADLQALSSQAATADALSAEIASTCLVK